MYGKEVIINVKDVLEDLGVRNVKAAGVETNYSCPEPSHSNGDHRPSAYMRSTYPYPFKCFACGAQGTITDFVAEFKGITRTEAWRWLGKTCGFSTTYDPEASVTETLNRILGPKNAPIYKKETNPVVKIGKNFLPLHQVYPGMEYMLKRSLTDDTIAGFNLVWDSLSGRVAIPYQRHSDWNTVGFKARDITGEHPAKYLVLGDRDNEFLGYGFKPFNVSLEMFGLFRVDQKATTLIVVEGEMNAMKIHQEGHWNAVGLPTAALSSYQAAMIRERFEKVILYLDCDDAGNRGVITAQNMIGSACEVRVVPHHEKDAMDSDHDEIEWLLTNTQNPATAKLKTLGGKK